MDYGWIFRRIEISRWHVARRILINVSGGGRLFGDYTLADSKVSESKLSIDYFGAWNVDLRFEGGDV